jgi:hypothetical protein
LLAVTEVGFAANPRIRGVLDSEIPAFEVERLPEGSGSLEESIVDQGMKESESQRVRPANQLDAR